MSYNKWIGGFLGFINTQSVLGAIAGFVIGSIFDSLGGKLFSSTTTSTPGNIPANDGERNGFLFSLMVLAAHIIQADGLIMHSEMEHVRRFLRANFGESAVSQGNDMLLKLFEYRKLNGEQRWQQQIKASCGEMAAAMPEEHRTQLMAFLSEIAKADGKIDPTEIKALKEIALYLRLDPSIVDRLLALGGDSLDDSYRALGVSPSATDDEVKQAYKKLVMKHHPDRVANLGDDVKEAATKKLQEINKAKDIIYKARNIK